MGKPGKEKILLYEVKKIIRIHQVKKKRRHTAAEKNLTERKKDHGGSHNLAGFQNDSKNNWYQRKGGSRNNQKRKGC